MVATNPLEHQPYPRLRLVTTPPSLPRYWLRRLIALLAIVFVVIALQLVVRSAVGVVSGSGGAAEPGVARSADSATTLVIQPGDTLWSIATAVAPERDPRAVVDELIELNGSATIQIGQRIELP